MKMTYIECDSIMDIKKSMLDTHRRIYELNPAYSATHMQARLCEYISAVQQAGK